MTWKDHGLIAGLLLAFVLSCGAMFITSDRWLELRALQIPDARQGQPIRIEYDRVFYREFDGEWGVFVWRIERGEWAAWCEAHGAWPYEPSKPDPNKTLEWLVAGKTQCFSLPAGDYAVDVRITANPGSPLSRTARLRSNVFSVLP